MVVFRENSEDIYAGIEWAEGSPEAKKLITFLVNEMGVRKIRFPQSSGIGIKPVSREGTERLVRKAIQYAIDNDRRSVSLVHKGNIMFTPEFRNRLDATISFGSLDHDVILRVVDKFLLELEAQLHEKKVDPSFSPKLREFLARRGFDPQMGARPMSRLIQDTIRKALADELLFGRLVSGGKVMIDIGDDDKIKLAFEEAIEPEVA